jgi:hypothetical protein
VEWRLDPLRTPGRNVHEGIPFVVATGMDLASRRKG